MFMKFCILLKKGLKLIKKTSEVSNVKSDSRFTQSLLNTFVGKQQKRIQQNLRLLSLNTSIVQWRQENNTGLRGSILVWPKPSLARNV